MANGRYNSAIAERLTVTIETVESHRAAIFGGLGVHGAHKVFRRVLTVLA